MAIKSTVEKFEYTANKFKIVRGEDITLLLHLFSADLIAMDLSNASAYETHLYGETGPVVIPTGGHSKINNNPGLVNLTLTSDQTEQLKVGESQTIEIVVSFTTYGQTTKKIVQIPDALTVIKGMNE